MMPNCFISISHITLTQMKPPATHTCTHCWSRTPGGGARHRHVLQHVEPMTGHPGQDESQYRTPVPQQKRVWPSRTSSFFNESFGENSHYHASVSSSDTTRAAAQTLTRYSASARRYQHEAQAVAAEAQDHSKHLDQLTFPINEKPPSTHNASTSTPHRRVLAAHMHLTCSALAIFYFVESAEHVRITHLRPI